MPRLRIRRATPDDLALLLRFRRALLRHHRDDPLFGRTHPDLTRRLRQTTQQRLAAPDAQGAVFLAFDGDTPLGTLAVEVRRSNPLLWPERFAYIAGAYVAPAARGRGVTRRLVAHAERWARRQGLTEFRLDHWSDNPLAEATWSRLGFRTVEIVRLRPITPAPAAGPARRRATADGRAPASPRARQSRRSSS